MGVAFNGAFNQGVYEYKADILQSSFVNFVIRRAPFFRILLRVIPEYRRCILKLTFCASPKLPCLEIKGRQFFRVCMRTKDFLNYISFTSRICQRNRGGGL